MYVFISSLSTRAATHCLVYAKRISDFRLSIGDDDDDDDVDDFDAGVIFLFSFFSSCQKMSTRIT